MTRKKGFLQYMVHKPIVRFVIAAVAVAGILIMAILGYRLLMHRRVTVPENAQESSNAGNATTTAEPENATSTAEPTKNNTTSTGLVAGT